MTTKQVIAFIETLQKEYDFQDNIVAYIEPAELKQAIKDETIQDYFDELNENRIFTDTEIIYYSNAIKYIQEHDQSMKECFEIASELGYETSNLNSELLASMLATRNNETDYQEFIDKVIEFINE